MAKRPFLAVLDYQSGGVLVRIHARNREEVGSVLPEPDWQIYLEGDPDAPNVPEDFALQESDIDEKAPWLHKQIYIQERKAEGKHLFFFKTEQESNVEHWEVWARSELEVQLMYPTFQSMTLKPITKEMFDVMRLCDIDNVSDFIINSGDA